MENSAKDSSILDQVIMKSPLGMAVLTPDEGSWLTVNPALYHMLGYSEEELLNRSFFEANADLAEEGDAPSFRDVRNGLMKASDGTYETEKRCRQGK